MADEELFAEEQAEILRKKHKYRELILSGRLRLPHEKAAKLVGPDCLYRLYGQPDHESCQRRKRVKRPSRLRR